MTEHYCEVCEIRHTETYCPSCDRHWGLPTIGGYDPELDEG